MCNRCCVHLHTGCVNYRSSYRYRYGIYIYIYTQTLFTLRTPFVYTWSMSICARECSGPKCPSGDPHVFLGLPAPSARFHHVHQKTDKAWLMCLYSLSMWIPLAWWKILVVLVSPLFALSQLRCPSSARCTRLVVLHSKLSRHALVLTLSHRLGTVKMWD